MAESNWVTVTLYELTGLASCRVLELKESAFLTCVVWNLLYSISGLEFLTWEKCDVFQAFFLGCQQVAPQEEEGSGSVECTGGRWGLGASLAYCKSLLWHVVLMVEFEKLAVGKSHCQETICYFESAETPEEENAFLCWLPLCFSCIGMWKVIEDLNWIS